MYEGILAEIRLFAGTFAPNGWAYCDGSTMAIMQNQALFSLIGTQFGGDGQKTFQLPNLPPVKAGNAEIRYIICLQGIYPQRD